MINVAQLLLANFAVWELEAGFAGSIAAVDVVNRSKARLAVILYVINYCAYHQDSF